MKTKKFKTSYLESDLAALIVDQFSRLESPEGIPFKTRHVDEGTVHITIGSQIFIINIIDKTNFS